MKKELRAYALAFQAHHRALKSEIKSSLEVKLTRNRLEMALSDLRARGREVLEEAENVVAHGGSSGPIRKQKHG